MDPWLLRVFLGDLGGAPPPSCTTLTHPDPLTHTYTHVAASSDVYAPLAGQVVEVNEALGQGGKASLINTSPYQDGWLGRIKLGTEGSGEVEGLMDEAAYTAFTEA